MKKKLHQLKIEMEIEFEIELEENFNFNDEEKLKKIFLFYHPGRTKILNFRKK